MKHKLKKTRAARRAADFKVTLPVYLEKRTNPQVFSLRNGLKPQKSLIIEFGAECQGFGKKWAHELKDLYSVKSLTTKKEGVDWKKAKLQKYSATQAASTAQAKKVPGKSFRHIRKQKVGL